MDGRIALTTGTRLALRNSEGGLVSYVIKKEIGRGGSCIAYDASYNDNLGNSKLVRIKECYPHVLKLTRREDGSLEADERDRQDLEIRKRRLIDAYQQNHDLFSSPALSNHVSNTSDIYEHGGTIYIVSTWSNSETLEEHRCASLRECVLLMASTGRVIQRIHEAGYLYLDLKPENVLTIAGSTDLVQLFDYDSMVSMADLADKKAVRTSYTKGFAPLEQQTGKLKKLGWHSDVYSLGAVLFYELWGHTPTAFDCDTSAVFDFEHMAFAGTYQDRLYWELTDFFHRTLVSFTGDRYAAMSEAVAHLELIARLSDDMLPWLRSTPMDAPAFFVGRAEELTALDELVHMPNRHIFSLHGLGGIGKSSLVREYLSHHRAEHDAVLYLYDNGDPDSLLEDDDAVHINTIEKAKEESAEEYLSRKLTALCRLCEEQSIIVVLDNFSGDHLKKAQRLLGLSWKVLLVSRDELPEDICPSLNLGELNAPELARLFERYAHCALNSEDRLSAFASIAESVDGHTLLLELIARQIARDYLSLSAAVALAQEFGFSHISETRVDYVKDQQTVRMTIKAILDQLFQIDQYTCNERHIMKLLSLFDAPGIPAQAFRTLADLNSMDAINALEDSGWLKTNHNWLSMHPVLREYVQSWPWQGEENYLASAEAFMGRLYELIKPAGKGNDSDKQFPEDYTRLWHLLRLAEQIVINIGITTPASQRLSYHLVMDAPVDQDELMLQRCLTLLKHSDYLDSDSVLRLYNEAAVLLRRLNYFDDALDTLKEMKAYLIRHPGAYYWAVYHNTTGNILHDMNAEKNFKRCMKHQDEAIAAAKLSRHPSAQKLLATCLMDKAMSLIDLGEDLKQCGKLLDEAVGIICKISGEYDYERYHWLCIVAMYHVKATGDSAKALRFLEEATRIADTSRDSTMAYADHLLDQCAPIFFEMGLMDEAIDAIQEAIQLCEENMEIASYRRLRFEAYLFLTQIYTNTGDYIKAEAIFDQLEPYRADSPYAFDESKPLCPQSIRNKAAEQRIQN